MTVDNQKRISPAAPGVPFYTPAQEPPVGTAVASNDEELPTLFKPLTIRGLTVQNRFAASPMCMYSADDGHLTDFHLVHLGAFAMRGVALTIVEATAVTPNGRISPADSGLWKDSQIAPLKRVVDFIHSQGQKAGIQIAHAGRKASTAPIWAAKVEAKNLAGPEVGGWPDNCWAPSAIPWDSKGWAQPKEMTIAQIGEVVEGFAAAAKRAVAAGIDVIEIHGAHGYLISSFLSPISNRRTDKYGGSFENRTRIVLEVVDAVRAAIPESMPLFLRISGTEWMEWSGQESWTIEDSIQLAKLLPDHGVDLLDVSSGGNNSQQKIDIHPYYQVSLAGKVREAIEAEGKKLLIGAVGMISNAEMARAIVQAGQKLNEEAAKKGTIEIEEEHGQTTQADLILVARHLLREPEFVLKTARQLNVKVTWPKQYERGEWPRSFKI